jgi:hypothetical protein
MAMTNAEHRLAAAMAQLIGSDVEELIAAARVEAREQVRVLLVDAMTEAMLDRACVLGANARTGGGPAVRAGERPAARAGFPADAEPAATTDAKPAATADTAPEPTGFYLYCVVPAGTKLPAGLGGIDSAHSPGLIRHERLAAVVSQVPLADFDEDRLRERLADMDWLERTARTHEHVLDTIGEQATLIPMRLCSVYRNKRGVIDMLAREAPALEDALEQLEGKTEWGVKVFANPNAGNGSGHSTDGDPDPADPADPPDSTDSGTSYMLRRQTEHNRRRDGDQRLHEICVTIHARLAELATAAITSAPQRPEVSGHPGEMLLNGVYLIENHQRDAFLGLVDALHAEHASEGLELQPSGPWPAYNFVPGTIGAAW